MENKNIYYQVPIICSYRGHRPALEDCVRWDTPDIPIPIFIEKGLLEDIIKVSLEEIRPAEIQKLRK